VAATRGDGAKALLLAAGEGTRLRPLTETVPKCLVPIAGRPLLDYWFAAFDRCGIGDVLINTHHLAEEVRAYLDAGPRRRGFHVEETHEPTLLGSAGTIHANPDWADGADACVIVYADNLSDIDLARPLAFHRGHADPLTMVLFRAENPRACGIASLDAEGRVVAFEEKPQQPTGDLANAGIYVVDGAAWREIAAMDAFDFGFDVLPAFVNRMRGWVFDGYHRDIGDRASLERAQRDAASVFRDAP
jgi:mannose-1-phosphate guanylyltransferase